MAQKLETDIVLNLAGNLTAKARQYGASMSNFARQNEKAMTLIKTTTAAAGRGIDTLGNRYVGMAAAFATGATVKGFVSLDRRLSRLSIAADISKDKAAELYNEIEKISNSQGIRIDPQETLSAIEEILTKTGDLNYAMENLPNIATVIQATGAAGQQVGGIFTEFKKLAIDSSEAAMQAIDVLNKQGKSGAFTLASMASFGPQIFAAYAATGRQGADAVTELGAALQVIRGGVGSDEKAVTAFEALIRDITSPDRVKKLKELGGINVFDPEKLKEGVEVMRPLPELMEEIVKRSGGLSKNLGQLNLTDEAKRALNPLIASLSQTGDIKNFEEFMAITGDGSVTMADAAIAANDAAASIQFLTNSLTGFANNRLAEPIKEIADAINGLSDETVDNWLRWGEAAIWAVGGVVAASKGLKAVNAVTRLLGSGKGQGSQGGRLQDLGAMPVFVVNMPAGGMVGGLAGDVAGSSTRATTRTGKVIGAAKSAAAIALPTYLAYEASSAGASVIDSVLANTIDGYKELDAKFTTKVKAFLGDKQAQAQDVEFYGADPMKYQPKEITPPAYMTGMYGTQQHTPYNPYSSSQSGEMKLKVEVSDDRVKVTPSYLPSGFTIDPDMGSN